MEFVPEGTKVVYHGSLVKHKDKTMTVVSHAPCLGGSRDNDGNIVEKYTLQYGNKFHDYVTNIRRESFTILRVG